MAFKKENVLDVFTRILPELLEENELQEVFAAISDELDNKALVAEEESEKFKDLALSVEGIQALCYLVGPLHFGWGDKFQARVERNKAIINFKSMVEKIQEQK